MILANGMIFITGSIEMKNQSMAKSITGFFHHRMAIMAMEINMKNGKRKDNVNGVFR
jgi:hypothetical protein